MDKILEMAESEGSVEYVQEPKQNILTFPGLEIHIHERLVYQNHTFTPMSYVLTQLGLLTHKMEKLGLMLIARSLSFGLVKIPQLDLFILFLMADRRHWLLSIKMVGGDIGWNDRNCNEEDCSLWEHFRNCPCFTAGCGIPGIRP